VHGTRPPKTLVALAVVAARGRRSATSASVRIGSGPIVAARDWQGALAARAGVC
jgi:hypothetical protein